MFSSLYAMDKKTCCSLGPSEDDVFNKEVECSRSSCCYHYSYGQNDRYKVVEAIVVGVVVGLWFAENAKNTSCFASLHHCTVA